MSATWMSGTMGDARVPGPSTYWLDAIVELAPMRARDLRRDFTPKPTQATPDVAAALRPSLPGGSLLTSEALNQALTEGRFACTAYLTAASDVVVLVALGE